MIWILKFIQQRQYNFGKTYLGVDVNMLYEGDVESPFSTTQAIQYIRLKFMFKVFAII